MTTGTGLDLGLNPGLSISNSEMATFKDCRRRWYLTYYRWWGLAPEDEPATGVRILGTRVHVALEAYYRDGTPPRQVIDLLYREAATGLSDRPLANLQKEHDLAVAMVTGYVDWVAETGADEGIEVVGAERDLVVPSAFPGISLRAKMDLRVLRTQDGAWRFIDHKTIDTFVSLTATLHINEQMRFYALLDLLDARATEAARPHTDGGLVNILRRVKRTSSARPPFYQRAEVHYNLEDLRSMWLRVHAVLRDLLAVRAQLDAHTDHRIAAYPTPSRDCSWKCPHFSLCPLMDDGSHWEDMGAMLYVRTDPYAYYAPTALPTPTEG